MTRVGVLALQGDVREHAAAVARIGAEPVGVRRLAELDSVDALIIPGGRAPEWIRVDPDVRRITEHFFARNLPIALICHGSQVPAVYGLLKGRKTACFPPITGDMENAGATVIDAPDVVDGNLVSCRGWPDMPRFGRAMMEVFSKSVNSASA